MNNNQLVVEIARSSYFINPQSGEEQFERAILTCAGPGCIRPYLQTVTLGVPIAQTLGPLRELPERYHLRSDRPGARPIYLPRFHDFSQPPNPHGNLPRLAGRPDLSITDEMLMNAWYGLDYALTLIRRTNIFFEHRIKVNMADPRCQAANSLRQHPGFDPGLTHDQIWVTMEILDRDNEVVADIAIFHNFRGQVPTIKVYDCYGGEGIATEFSPVGQAALQYYESYIHDTEAEREPDQIVYKTTFRPPRLSDGDIEMNHGGAWLFHTACLEFLSVYPAYRIHRAPNATLEDPVLEDDASQVFYPSHTNIIAVDAMEKLYLYG